MKPKRLSIIILVLLSLSSCTEIKDCCQLIESDITATWQLFEQGYSPGSGYIVEEIPEVPLQTITLTHEGKFSSNISGLEGFDKYEILSDSLSDKSILAIYGMNTTEEEKDSLYYTIEMTDENTMKLYFRFCIEGCHMAFKRLHIQE